MMGGSAHSSWLVSLSYNPFPSLQAGAVPALPSAPAKVKITKNAVRIKVESEFSDVFEFKAASKNKSTIADIRY